MAYKLSDLIYFKAERLGFTPIEYEYKAVQYDPFDLFKPSKSLIQEKIKEFKQQCYTLLEQKRNPDYEIVYEILDKRHQELLRKIKRYQAYLNGPSNLDITERNKQVAKQYPIINLINEKYRRVNGRYHLKCPFHDDSTPSFIIYPNNTYYCFGCQVSGDSITFAQKTLNLNFKEAVQYLTQKL